MTPDHATLVATASRIFGGQVVAEHTYESFRDQLFAWVKEDHRHESYEWRLHFLYRLAARLAATWRPPFDGWAKHLFENELPKLEKTLRENGVL